MCVGYSVGVCQVCCVYIGCQSKHNAFKQRGRSDAEPSFAIATPVSSAFFFLSKFALPITALRHRSIPRVSVFVNRKGEGWRTRVNV